MTRIVVAAVVSCVGWGWGCMTSSGGPHDRRHGPLEEEVDAQLPVDAVPGHVVDLAACVEERWFEWLPLGSMWIETKVTASNECELLLGGETENPLYDGAATGRCVFPRTGKIVVPIGIGGPAFIDDPQHCGPP